MRNRGNPQRRRAATLCLTAVAAITSALTAPVWAAGGANRPTPAAKRPNVLLIMADDLRDTIGAYGDRMARTPNIDRLAARGVRFERAYVQYPVCNPSRSSLLTGLRPDRTGVTNNTTLLRDKLPDVVTLPQLLRENGWYTASYGKIFHHAGSNAEQQARWADQTRSWDEVHRFKTTPEGKVIEGRNLTGGALEWCHWGMTAGTDDDQPDGQNAREAIRLIEKQDRDEKPWMVAVGFHKPHDPFIAPKKYFDMYPAGSLTLRRNPSDISPAPPLAVGFGAYATAFDKFTDTERMEFTRAYYAGVSFTDAQVGRLMETLDRRKLWDNTIVIFISDHGYHLGERNWWNKNTLFERSVRTPMIVAAPGIKPGVARGLTEFVDLFPTVAEMCGIVKLPSGLAGESLLPLLKDPSKPGKTAAFTLVTRGAKQRGDSIRTDRWRYTEWSDGTRELYDHRTDPEETRNVADLPENKAIVADLTKRLKAR